MRNDELLNLFSPLSPIAGLLRNELVLEWFFWMLALVIAVLLLIFRPAGLEKIERHWKAVSRRRGLAVGITIFCSLALRLLLLPVLPIPAPAIHDEYSYLLQAKTFAAGRLTNPTPAMWEHFETFHVNMVPTYQSMYPPAQGLMLAGAEVLHLHPWWAVWLSVGLMCGGVCWMLQGWMPPQWAFLGGMFCVIRFSTFSYWVNSYFGGALAAIGGALLLGALPRIKRKPGLGYPLLFAFALALLANNRPFEGLVLSIPTMIALLLWMLGSGRKQPLRISRFVPAAALLLAAGAGMAYYNWRGTGDPMVMPYQANEQQYHITKPFIWQTRKPIPNYHHQVMRTMYVGHELPDYLNRRYPELFWKSVKLKIEFYYDFYLWPLMELALFACLAMLKSQRVRLLAISLLGLFAGLLIEQWPLNPHYSAPGLCLVVAIMLYGLRLLHTWKPRDLPVGPMLAKSVVLCFALWVMVPAAVKAFNPYMLGVYEEMPSNVDRVRLQDQLESKPGQHILLVHNRLSASGLFDWVYNEPDLNTAKIIWARDMGEEANEQLIRAYPNRQVWIVDQDDGLRRLTPYQSHVEETDPVRILNVAANQPVADRR